MLLLKEESGISDEETINDYLIFSISIRLSLSEQDGADLSTQFINYHLGLLPTMPYNARATEITISYADFPLSGRIYRLFDFSLFAFDLISVSTPVCSNARQPRTTRFP